jgi:hypothetical protein
MAFSSNSLHSTWGSSVRSDFSASVSHDTSGHNALNAREIAVEEEEAEEEEESWRSDIFTPARTDKAVLAPAQSSPDSLLWQPTSSVRRKKQPKATRRSISRPSGSGTDIRGRTVSRISSQSPVRQAKKKREKQDVSPNRDRSAERIDDDFSAPSSRRVRPTSRSQSPLLLQPTPTATSTPTHTPTHTHSQNTTPSVTRRTRHANPPSPPRDSNDSAFENFETGLDWGDDIAGVEEIIEPIALNDDEDWGEETKEDDWCFLCMVSDEKDEIRNNQYYLDIVRIFNNKNNMTRFNMCRTVRRKYMKDFYEYQVGENKRDWTLRGIRAHAEKHGGMDAEARNQDLQTICFQCIQEIARNQLRAREPSTGRTFITTGGASLMVKMIMARSKLVSEATR